MTEILDIIKSRRSVRKYSPDQINQLELDKILEAGVFAPSAHNQQPWHFTVIQNPELLESINLIVREAMAKSDVEWVRKTGSNPGFKVTYDAPTLVIVSGRKDGIASITDCSAAIQNMLIAAESMGIGSVWLGLMRFLFDKPEEVAKLHIPDNYQPFYGVSFGYRVEGHVQPVPKRNFNVVNYIR